MKNSGLGIFLCLALVFGIALACSFDSGNVSQNHMPLKEEDFPKKLETTEIKGFKFAYYLIPKNLSREELIKVAQEIHDREHDTQLILVDDESKVTEYIEFVKDLNSEKSNKNFPRHWAESHIVANVQKYMNGRWVLCKGYGFEEIADLK